MTHTKTITQLLALSALSLSPLACDDSTTTGSGAVSVLVEAEDIVTRGLSAGDGVADIQDGWDVSFERYLVALGPVTFSRDGAEVNAQGSLSPSSSAYVLDLTALPANGLEVWRAEDLSAARWDVSYETPSAAEGALAGLGVTEDEVNTMSEGDLTYWIKGSLSQAEGVSCPPAELATPLAELMPMGESELGDPCYAAPSVSFELQAEAETLYGPCELDGVPGVAVPNGGVTTLTVTLHVDHLFFNGFPEGAEGGVSRLAQWLANSDLNLDGLVTMDELAQISPERLLDTTRFQLGGSPLTPLDNLATYVKAQLKTQGHYQGEGECAADGIAHEHEGEHEGE